ncbi:MAG TPA: hypothetical protein VIS29_12015 [Streptomyces sp.]
MANANPSRIGQNQGTGATDALWLDVFGGEVFTAFEMAVKMKGKVRERTIGSGRSARFPAMYKAVGQYHVPGTEIAGQGLLHGEITLTTDDLLIAPAEIAQIDELKNHYDVRGPYASELGRALATIYDRMVSQSIIAASRGAELFAGDGGGSKVVQTDVGVSADFSTSGSDLWEAVKASVQAMDVKDVPVEQIPVYAAFLPAQWYLMATANMNVDRDFNGGDVTSRKLALPNAYGVEVIKSNALLFGKDVTAYNAGTNADGLVGKPNDVRYGLPATFPSKYQGDNANTKGIVWTDAAAGVLNLLGLQMEQEWDARRQVTFMLAKMASGAGPLRTKCAVEIATS